MNRGFDILAAIVFVGGIMVLVRPRSQGPAFVKSIGSSLTSLLQAATGGGTF